MTTIHLTILGQPCSKANSRRLVKFGERPAFVKSKEALAYERDALKQIPPSARLMILGPVKVTLRLFYASERPDLDESIVLDVLQAKYTKAVGDVPRSLIHRGVYVNDRQVREKHVYHAIDKANPRAEIEVEPLDPQLFVMDEGKPVVALHAKQPIPETPF